MLKSMIRGTETVGHSPGMFRNERRSRCELQQNEIQATLSKNHKVPPVEKELHLSWVFATMDTPKYGETLRDA